MDINKFTCKLSHMALAFAMCLPLSYAHATTPVEFDPDGKGGMSAVTILTLDWAPDSGLIEGAIPLQPGSTVNAQAYLHAELISVNDPNGKKVPLPDLNATYEITAFSSNGIQIATNSDGTNVLLALDPGGNGDNFFQIRYDDSPDANALLGTGYSDGDVILSGQLVTLSGNFTATNLDPPYVDLDKFTTQNWPNVKTISGVGAQDVGILVQFVDKDFFPSGVDLGTILPFNNSQVLPFQQNNPSMSFDFDTDGGVIVANVGDINGIGDFEGGEGYDILLQNDANNAFEFLPPELACRVTGGGNDSGIFENGTAGWSGTYAEDEITPLATNKNGKVIGKTNDVTPYRYTMGGQAGANTSEQPQPKGEWTHTNHDGPGGLMFTFHAGTASAPDGTEIDEIICTDPGSCFPARPAPNKQIDFVGIGTFKNLKFKGPKPEVTNVGVVDSAFETILPEPNGNQDGETSYHWFQVHIEDLGEPGNKAEEGLTEDDCPDTGSGNDPFADPPVTDNLANCDCADFYRIKIYKGFIPVLDENGEITNTDDINMSDVIYEVYGYIDGGNFQIHPQTGFDLR